MGTTPTKAQIEVPPQVPANAMSGWPRGASAFSDVSIDGARQPSHRDALQGLLAFSALHEQVRRRRALAGHNRGFDLTTPVSEFEEGEQFVLDDVLQLVAERAVAITGADGLAIALAENNEIVLRASAGSIKPDIGARIDRDSAFSGACFRLAQVVRCDDTENDSRVNRQACLQLGARSMLAVPLCGRRRVIGLLEAFSAEPFAFNDSDVRSLELLAELVLGALRPEDEDRFAASADAAAARLKNVSLPQGSPANLTFEKFTAVAANEELAGSRAAVDDEPILLEIEAASTLESAFEARAAVDDELILSDTESALARQSPVVSSPVRDEAERIADQTSVPAFATAIEDDGGHPGAVIVLVLVVIAALLGATWWWKLKNAQIGSAMVQSAPQPSATAVSSGANPIASSPNMPSSANAAVAEGAALSPQLAAATADESGDATEQDATTLPRVTGIRHWSSADSSTVVLDLQDQVQYEAHRLAAPDRIYFDLHDTALAPDLAGKSIDVGDALLTRIRVAQPVAGMTRVVLETKANSNFSVSLEPNPYRLVVEVRKLGVAPKAKIDLFPGEAEAEKDKLAIVVPPPTQEDLQLRAKLPRMRIVVDAGHGGWDLGTVGRRGLLEKDVVLEIAQRLGKLLESRLGAEVILTRNDDNYVPLDERAGIANQAQADLFVSVHANYSDLPSARGVETYYTNFFTVPGAKETDVREDRSGPSPTKSTFTAALSPAELHDKIEQSRRLAASVQRSLYGTLVTQNPGLRDRGVKQASYAVLTETSMPGILAEVSFVSSPTDEQKLRSDGYREHIAEALYKGIARYAASSRGVKVAER